MFIAYFISATLKLYFMFQKITSLHFSQQYYWTKDKRQNLIYMSKNNEWS